MVLERALPHEKSTTLLDFPVGIYKVPKRKPLLVMAKLLKWVCPFQRSRPANAASELLRGSG
jgi:hypothetical protein